MAKKDQYHPDYEAIYPGIEKYPEILNTLDFTIKFKRTSH